MEEQAPFGKPATELPSYLEKVQSQLPALQLLINMGWGYLTPEETVNLRGGRLGSTILEPSLLDHIRNHCRYEFKGNTHPFTENAIQNAVQALKGFRATGATHQNEQAYDLKGNDMARSYYGCVRDPISAYAVNDDKPGTEIALLVVERIARHKIRDWRTNEDAINKMRGEIDDILFEVAEEHGLELSLDDHDGIIDRCIEVAIANED